MKTPVPEPLFSEAEACNFIEKDTLAQVFSYEFCKYAKNTFSFRRPPVAVSVICLWSRWNPSIKNKMVLILTRVFLVTNSLKVVYILSKMRLTITEVLNALFQASVYVTIVTAIVYYKSTTVRKILDILLAVELLIYSKKYVLI